MKENVQKVSSFMGVSDAAEAGNNMVLDGTEYAVSIMNGPDAVI